ncbi:MAG: L-fucose:H+ symporter permease [Prevotellaceae bacterium]|jgi:FHS family L-fucose permease-like MFS transporter|nr:L-fucose:H+ symporter permease [Prevotellaceae bacterium]
MNSHTKKIPVVPRAMLLPFVLVTSLFALWGFANDITNPMVAAFKDILAISNFESSLVQLAFYGGYCLMAIPAALFIKRYGYKMGIIVGLLFYSLGCLLFIPAGHVQAFSVFLTAYFVMTCGLSFLETTSNPYILSLGAEGSATRRLNFSQAFNPIGSLTGMLIAKELILYKLDALKTVAPLATQKTEALDILSTPYLVLGLVVFAFFLLFAISRLPKGETVGVAGQSTATLAVFRRLIKNRVYTSSVVAQAFYVGVQIMVWTFIIQYAEKELGLDKNTAQGYNMIAMGIFVTSRFICTFLLKYIRPSLLLSCLAVGGAAFTLGAIVLHGWAGLYSLIAISACMSLMFPTIYGIALKGLGDDAKLASAGLILAIGGGAIFPPLQGLLIDKAVWFGDAMSSVRVSFALPLLCFVVIAVFGRWVGKMRTVK